MICATCGHPRDDHGPAFCVGAVECTCDRDRFTTTPTASPLPYGDTAGHSGSPASRERAEAEAADGTAHARRQTTLAALRTAGEDGLTWVELGTAHGWHHGISTGMLSGLHKQGLVARLDGRQYRRQRSAPYVLPEFAGDRPVAPHGSERVRISPDERDALVAFRTEALSGRFTSATWDALLAAGERLA